MNGRLSHYGSFYGDDQVPDGGRPLALVHGNCQAESLRLFLDAEDLATIRIPPVHELVAGDISHLERWLRRADVLVSQPVRDGYRSLPLGTAQLAARMGGDPRVVLVPAIRFAGLYPTHAIIRPPSDRSLVPPVVAYHDLRVLAEAAGRPRMAASEPTTAAVRAVAELSLEALRTREKAHGTVLASDLLIPPSFAQMRTLNHPGNAIWAPLSARVRAAIGLRERPGDPGRPVLDAIHAPRSAAVIEAFGLPDEPTHAWTVDGATIDEEDVREAHLRWYAAHPDAVAAGLERHAEALALLGLG